MRILITGGAGFIGGAIALYWKNRYPCDHITVFDNLYRRGSEKSLSSFEEKGISFVHGDVRLAEDWAVLSPPFDVIIDGAAEPSVTSLRDHPQKIFHINVEGSLLSLEFARSKGVGLFIFLSSSRVYPIELLRELPLKIALDRFMSDQLIDEEFGKEISSSRFHHRSFYGYSKWAVEGLLQEYGSAFGINILINRLGLVAGPCQWGRRDQGLVSYWMKTVLTNPEQLCFKGFGGEGKQVRDLLHINDLCVLIERQINCGKGAGEIYNVGGGPFSNFSLKELHHFCEEKRGIAFSVLSERESDKDDVPYYVSDVSKVSKFYQWKPSFNITQSFEDIWKWMEVYGRK